MRLLPLLTLLLCCLLPHPARAQATGSDATTTGTIANKYAFPSAFSAPTVTQEEIEKILKTHGSEVLVVNFWATWCGPCREEIPDFVKVSNEYSPDRVRFIGISLDFQRDVETKLIPYLREQKIEYPNVVFKGNPEATINFFDPEWSGAIPATFIYNASGKRVSSHLEPLHYDQLKAAVEQALRTPASASGG